MKTDLFITVCVGMMVNAVVFGTGAVTVLSVPAWNAEARYLLPAVVVFAFAVSPFIARLIAPRLRLRHWHGRHGDMISG